MVVEVRFDDPPVIELVFGVAFATLKKFSTPHVGIFWQSLGPDFQRVEDVSLLGPPSGRLTLDFAEPMQWPRVWMFSEDGNHLVQVQKDRFLYNWKSAKGDAGYPTFGRIFPTFQAHFGTFRSFVSDNELGEFEFRQFELTYVNHIPYDSVVPEVRGIGSDILVDHVRDESRERFLPIPFMINWQSQFQLPDDAGVLSATARSGKSPEDGEPLLRLDLSVRGITEDVSDEGMIRWFELAHDWIVQGFTDMTAPDMQERVWRRNQ